MKFLLILGAQAVGKMTVGEEIEKITDLKLFHGHMTIELVSKFFNYGTPSGKRLVKLFREEIFKEAIASDLYGLMFTYVCAFDEEYDINYVNNLINYFEMNGADVSVVELEADIKIRELRNVTPHRLQEKPTKRNIEWSQAEIVRSNNKYRLTSYDGEIKTDSYLRINNENLEASEVAKIIKKTFNL